ncbi:uncharacterized protein BDR25DRAFT_356449 [Lindgomyces ingoldianus]|uniref:Uncharacterized protein n=1 Tax=Lindgomyces ingoldianus TaxID=673940 RepID=A0ACB6QRU9_9PLEO|nr:uncharacterized protein BDR25DRAFT_356449 [Lindgomyces ingoldianus]KAF2469708.1 hypothetical protein BDR25DRAFT_356449 [Lindgomyces ingoldianus]
MLPGEIEMRKERLPRSEAQRTQYFGINIRERSAFSARLLFLRGALSNEEMQSIGMEGVSESFSVFAFCGREYLLTGLARPPEKDGNIQRSTIIFHLNVFALRAENSLGLADSMLRRTVSCTVSGLPEMNDGFGYDAVLDNSQTVPSTPHFPDNAYLA